jgi:hypothetical protein
MTLTLQLLNVTRSLAELDVNDKRPFDNYEGRN